MLEGKSWRFAQLPLGRDFDELARHLEDAALHARLASLPGATAETIEIDRGVLVAIAREQLDVLDRQEQPVAAPIMDFQTIFRPAPPLDGFQADKPPDTVIDMADETAN